MSTHDRGNCWSSDIVAAPEFYVKQIIEWNNLAYETNYWMKQLNHETDYISRNKSLQGLEDDTIIFRRVIPQWNLRSISVFISVHLRSILFISDFIVFLSSFHSVHLVHLRHLRSSSLISVFISIFISDFISRWSRFITIISIFISVISDFIYVCLRFILLISVHPRSSSFSYRFISLSRFISVHILKQIQQIHFNKIPNWNICVHCRLPSITNQQLLIFWKLDSIFN